MLGSTVPHICNEPRPNADDVCYGCIARMRMEPSIPMQLRDKLANFSDLTAEQRLGLYGELHRALIVFEDALAALNTQAQYREGGPARNFYILHPEYRYNVVDFVD